MLRLKNNVDTILSYHKLILDRDNLSYEESLEYFSLRPIQFDVVKMRNGFYKIVVVISNNDPESVHRKESERVIREEIRNVNWADFKKFKTHRKARKFALKMMDFYNNKVYKLTNERESSVEKIVETIR